MKSVRGRITDIIVAPNGNYLSVFDAPLSNMSQIKGYQIVQEKYDQLVVKIVKSRDYKEEDTEKIIKVMKQYLGKDVNLAIDFVSFIPTSKSGKRKFVISKVPIEFGV